MCRTRRSSNTETLAQRQGRAVGGSGAVSKAASPGAPAGPEAKSKPQIVAQHGPDLTSRVDDRVRQLSRAFVVAVLLVVLWQTERVDAAIDGWYQEARRGLLANQYFEAWSPTVFYPLCTTFWLTVAAVDRRTGCFARFRLQPAGVRRHEVVEGPLRISLGFFIYVVPVFLLEWRKTPRIDRLPATIPGVWGLAGSTLLNMLIFDTFFFIIHFAFHRSRWLYRNVHSVHHRDSMPVPTDANWVSPVERLSLVLSAAGALNLTGAHPVVRSLMTAYAVYFLVENHCSYLFPCMWSEIVPCNIISGPREHDAHHRYSSLCYAEYFTHWDKLLLRLFPKTATL